MTKCGKGCMPECEYFTTGGCISPFNCPYKIETGYINSATSIPTYMEQYNRMSDDDIERCLERLSTCKATDVMNFDYSATLAYIKRLKAENAALRERLKKAVELPCEIGDEVYEVHRKCDRKNCPYNGDYGQWRCIYGGKRNCKPFITVNEFCYSDIPRVGKTIFVTKEAAEARLAELKGENK